MRRSIWLSAASIMTREVVTVGPDDTVSEMAQTMCKHQVNSVPVRDDKGTILGIVSQTDLIRPFAAANALNNDWWLELLADKDALMPAFLDYLKNDKRRARDVMVSPVITAPAGASVPEVADLLVRHRVQRLPITRRGRLLGIVSRADIVRAIAQRPELPSS